MYINRSTVQKCHELESTDTCSESSEVFIIKRTFSKVKVTEKCTSYQLPERPLSSSRRETNLPLICNLQKNTGAVKCGPGFVFGGSCKLPLQPVALTHTCCGPRVFLASIVSKWLHVSVTIREQREWLKSLCFEQCHDDKGSTQHFFSLFFFSVKLSPPLTPGLKVSIVRAHT